MGRLMAANPERVFLLATGKKGYGLKDPKNLYKHHPHDKIGIMALAYSAV